MSQLKIPVGSDRQERQETLSEQFAGLDINVEVTSTDQHLVVDFSDVEEATAFTVQEEDVPAIDVSIPWSSQDTRETVSEVEQVFHDLGVTFDTGTGMMGNGGTFVRSWHLDWSLEGGVVELSQ